MPPTRNGNTSSSLQLGMIKNFLLVALGLAALVYAAAFAFQVYSTTANSYPPRTFSATAEAKEFVVPDVATFTFTVLTEGGLDLNTLQQTNTEKTNLAVAYLKEQQVDNKDIKTQNYSVNPRYQYSNCYELGELVCPPAEIVGYSISQTVQVKIRDLAKVGDLLDGVVKRGANNVSQLSFVIDDETTIREQVRLEAIQKARNAAQAMARAGNFRLGRLVSIYENGVNPGPYPYYGETMAMGAGTKDLNVSVPPSIESGSNEISSSVSLIYELY